MHKNKNSEKEIMVDTYYVHISLESLAHDKCNNGYNESKSFKPNQLIIHCAFLET